MESRPRSRLTVFALWWSIAAAACNSSTKPSVSVASASPVSPANGTQVVYNTQPVKLLVDNGVATGGAPVRDTFDVATDAAFGTLVVSRSVPQSTSGQTLLVLDPLLPATYYWRVRAVAADAALLSSTFTFKVALPTPVLVSPANGVQVAYNTQPAKLVVDNGAATGGVLVSDTFEVATDPAFGTLVVSKSLPQSASGQASLTLDPLPPATYYWRARATAGDATATSPTFMFNVAVVLPAPIVIAPASGVLIGHLDQPVMLIVQNPPATPPVSGVMNSFEVASDTALTNIVVSKTVPMAAAGPTALVLDPLSPNTYYWRVRAAASGAIGATSATAMFRVGPAIMSGTYQLTIELPASCQIPYSNVLLVIGDLTVADRTWQFRATDNIAYYMGMLQLILNPVRTTASGTVQAKFKSVDNTPFYLSIGLLSDTAPPPIVPVSASVSPDALIDGTLNSKIDLLHRTFSIRHFCTSSFHWILAPK